MNPRNLLQHFGRLSASAICLPSNLIVMLITGYQKTLSPDHGPLKHLFTYGYCRHHPTCSEYAKEQITKNGLVVGGMRSIVRILSCNPFAKVSDEKWREMSSQIH